MTKLILSAFLFSSVLAQAQRGPALHPHALDDSVFQSCEEVLSHARQFSSELRDPAYLIELFPKSQGRVGPPFLSEVTAWSATQWLTTHDSKTLPYALFYFAKGAYTLRCRDNEGNYVKLSGPLGSPSPLELNFAAGKAQLWHFYFTPINVAHVFVVTDTLPDVLGGEALLAQVQKVLSARYVFLYARNDPWFLGVAPDPLLYLFTDSFKGISEQEYRISRTLTCYTGSGCKIGPSAN
jgi:hypothetical protein